MRIVVLGSSVYSETTCAMAVRLAGCGYVPVGALVLSTWKRGTLLRKLTQWGVRDAARFAKKKLIPSLWRFPAESTQPSSSAVAGESEWYFP